MDIENELPVGEMLPFYGAWGNRFLLGDTVYEAIEDENDGYRSSCREVLASADQSRGGFFNQPLTTVLVAKRNDGTDYNAFDGFVLVGVLDGHEWLRLGTSNCDDYYPYFTFEYTPPTDRTW